MEQSQASPNRSSSSSEDISSEQSAISMSSILEQLPLICRAEQFQYFDAVRSATYSKSELVNGALRWHNILRSQHQTPPLTLSLKLCQRAQFWANHLAHTDTFYYSTETNIGQNLMSKWSYDSYTDLTAEEIVKYWYHYVIEYNFDLEDNILHTQASHFTQMIWKDSVQFGIGKARSRSGKLIVVANYYPAGNIRHRFRENVLPPVNMPRLLNNRRKQSPNESQCSTLFSKRNYSLDSLDSTKSNLDLMK